jgi:hypothetical protein
MGRDSLVRGVAVFLWADVTTREAARSAESYRKKKAFSKSVVFSYRFWRLAVGSTASRILRDKLILMELDQRAIHPASDDSKCFTE